MNLNVPNKLTLRNKFYTKTNKMNVKNWIACRIV